MTINVERVLKSPKLPTLPSVAVKLLRLIGSDDLNTEEICATIKTDPALSARVLKSANSSYYGLRTQVKSIEHAALLLGPGALTSICLTFALSSSSLPGGVAAENFRRYWVHSVLQAVTAESLAQQQKDRDASTMFLCGLLCDIGTLAILKAFPQEYHEVFQLQQNSDRDVLEIEQELLGVDHVQIGTELSRLWQLPENFHQCIMRHHDSLSELAGRRSEPVFKLVAASAFASSVSDFLSRGQQAGDHERLILQARELFGLKDSVTHNLLGIVRTRSESLPDDFGIDVGYIPDAEDIMSQANELLASITLHAQATTVEALASNQELESKNRSLLAECEQLEKRATSDHLTQLYNRSYFDTEVDRCLQGAICEPLDVGLMMCDIDHFKQLNDTFGHPFGDVVLKQVAHALNAGVSAPSLVARYGGEEFAVLVRGKTVDGVVAVAESLRRAVQELRLTCGNVPVQLTMSIGVCFTQAAGPPRKNARQLLMAIADGALYHAKRQGRNQVRLEQTAYETATRGEPPMPTAEKSSRHAAPPADGSPASHLAP